VHVPFSEDQDEDQDSDLYLVVDDGLIQEAVTSGGDSSLWGGTDEECEQGKMTSKDAKESSGNPGGSGGSDKCGQDSGGKSQDQTATSGDPPAQQDSAEGG
jgi:hypothetical protein